MAFVISGGSLQRVQRPLVPAPMVVTLADGLSVEYAEIYRTQPQVRTVVSFLARNIAHLSLHAYHRVSDTDRERVIDHELPRLLGRPNPATTPYRYINSLVSDVGIFDNAIHCKVKAAGRRALVRLDPRRVLPIGDNPFWPEGYRICGSRGNKEIPADQVIHFRGYNPLDSRWGLSPIESLRQLLIEEYQAGLYREQMWRNSARVTGYLKRPIEAPKWSGGGKERFKLDWRNQYLGNGSEAGGTPILEDGMEFVPASLSPEDAQYIQARKLTREETAAAYHIPPTLVGILDHATYCLPADALVSTERGPVPIAGVRVGDHVWSLVNGELRSMPVTWSGQTGFKPLLTIRTQNRTLRCTDNHPVLTRRRVRTDTSEHPNRRRYQWEHAWVPAGELAVGDVVVTLSELPDHATCYAYADRTGRVPIQPPTGCGHAKIVSIAVDGDPVPVYDLTVDGSHNFVAEGVVVHNSNVAEQHKQLYQDTLGPWLEEIQQEFELQLLPDFPDTERMYVEFNLAEKLKGSFEDQAQQLQTSVGAPYMTRNEARARLNLPSIDGGDELVTPLNVIIGGQASPTDSAPPPKAQPPVLRRVKTLAGEPGGSVKVKTCRVKIQKAGSQDGTEDGVFEAIVATYDLDSVGDRIIPGAFEDTLKEWAATGDPIPVLWSHMSFDPDYHIGEVLEAEERPEGLWVKARIDLDDDGPSKAKKVYKLLKGRRVTQFSFAYDIEEGAFVTNNEKDEYYFELRKLKLYEVGPCLIGANQETELLTIKNGRPVSHPVASLPEGLVKIADCLALLKAGRVLSAKNEERLQEIARLAAEVLDSVSTDSDDGKATSAPPAPAASSELAPTDATVTARLGPADLRQRLDLDLLLVGV